MHLRHVNRLSVWNLVPIISISARPSQWFPVAYRIMCNLLLASLKIKLRFAFSSLNHLLHTSNSNITTWKSWNFIMYVLFFILCLILLWNFSHISWLWFCFPSPLQVQNHLHSWFSVHFCGSEFEGEVLQEQSKIHSFMVICQVLFQDLG